jgi:enoyl-CoA hydratase
MTRTRTRIEDDIAWITLDDGKVNAMSIPMLDEIGAAFDDVTTRARVVVLQGRPGILSAGFDLGTFREGPKAAQAMLDRGVALILQLLSHPTPIVAGCTGHAYPMGAFLMLCSDVRIGIVGDWKIGMNEVTIGLTVPRFALALARHRLTPPGFARITSASMFGPEEAKMYGYLDEVVPAAALDVRCLEVAQQLRSVDPASYVATKTRIHESLQEAIRNNPY